MCKVGRALIAVAMVWTATNAAAADPVDTFCRSVESSINALADFTRTRCLPTAGSSKERNSFIILSDKPVFSNEKSKKAWLLVACAAAGRELNKSGAIQADELWFSDVARTKERTAYAARAAACKSLQAKVHSGSISIDQMYGTLSAELVRKDVRK
jgi:hypothetical protein